MPKILKRTLQILLALVVVIILAAVAIPYFFKDQIVAKIKEDINKNVNAKVDFKEVSLSLFRSFPDFSFKLDSFEIVGIEEFENLKLFAADNIDFTLDLMSVIRTSEPIEIKSFHLEKPEVNIKILRNGKANYDIAKVDSTATQTPEESQPYNFLIKLKEYSINDGSFVYDDKQGDIFAELKGLDHSGSGQFTADVYDVFTKTTIENLTAISGGMTYLKKAKADLDVILNADMNTMKFTLKENQIVLNALTLKLDGFVQMEGDDINMDLTYSAPQNKFKNFLSLIPSAYTADYADVQANGDLQFGGFVKGTYNGLTGKMPAFQVDLKIDNGDFKYPDLPLGVTDINTQTRINSPSSDFDKITIDVSRFSMNLGGNPFEAVFKLKTPISDPDMDAKINGKINLEELAKAFPMEGVETLNGLITSNLKIKTRMSMIDKQDYENIDMSGDLQIENMNYLSQGQPAVKINDMKMSFNPKNVTLENFDALLGKSDIKARGTIDNILAYFSPEKTMKGDVVVRSNFFDANEWLVEEEAPATQAPTANAEVAQTEVFDQFDFTIDGQVGKILYDVYQLDNTSMKGNITPSQARIESFYTKIDKSDFSASGTIDNIFNYLFDNETLSGDIKLVSNFIDLNQFMVEETTTGEPQAKTIADEDPELAPIPVPANIDFDIDASIGKVTYTNIDLKDIKGKMLIKNETVELQNCTAKTMGGSFTMDGSYNSQNINSPSFDLKYSINSFDFQQAFNQVNTFAILAPIGKFIQGTFNTKMAMSGTLDKNMFPDLGTISIDGFIETLNGLVKGFKPIEEFSSLLNLQDLKTLKIQNTKNWFEVKNGLVTLKDFNYTYQGIAMEIGGTHGITKDMNYNIKAKIPRNLLEKNTVTAAANQGLKYLEKEASKIGIDLKAGEFVNVLFNISGALTSPKFKLTLLNAEGAATSLKDIAENLVSEAVDTAKAIAKEQIAIAKDTIAKVIDTTKEDLRKKADAEIAKLMAEADKQAKSIRDAAKKLADETNKTGYANADQLIVEAGNNVLKKKGAEIAANSLRKETDKKVKQIIDEGDKKAQAVIDNAEKQADAVLKKYGLE